MRATGDVYKNVYNSKLLEGVQERGWVNGFSAE